jgi:hypothetical protein
MWAHYWYLPELTDNIEIPCVEREMKIDKGSHEFTTFGISNCWTRQLYIIAKIAGKLTD